VADGALQTDTRVQTITETMNVLRMVKLFGWERKMNERVGARRADELRLILKRKLLELANGNLNYVIPLSHMLVSFSVYTLVMKKPLTCTYCRWTVRACLLIARSVRGLLNDERVHRAPRAAVDGPWHGPDAHPR
jgi:hypothetical protein